MTITVIRCVLLCLIFVSWVALYWITVRLLNQANEYRELAEIYEHLYRELAARCKEEDANSENVMAEYYISESDLIKYRSNKSMVNAIKNRLAMNLGDVIIKKFPPAYKKEKKAYCIAVKVKKI